MGFLDKIKSVKNAITGGAAKVTVEVQGKSRMEPFHVVVRATAEADLKVKRVYLIVRGVEQASVHNIDVAQGNSTRRQTVTGETERVRVEVDIAGAQDLKQGEGYTWEGQVQLPAGALATFAGDTIRHVWTIQAGLDAVGNDPDSGWVEFEVA